MTSSPGPAGDPAERLARRVLAVAALGTMLTLVSFTAPVATVNAISQGLEADVAGRTWVLSSMSVGLGAALLSAGTLADDRGRRRTFVAGLLLLAAASVAGAAAPSAPVFVLARVVQGVGAAAVIASSLGLVAHQFPVGPARAGASGVWGASVGAGISVGPILAAGLDQRWWAYGSWRDVYVVIAVAAIGLAWWAHRGVPESRAEEERPLDLPGATLLGLGVSALLAGLVEGRQGWTRPVVLTLLVGSVVLLAGFVRAELRSAAPMLDLRLFRRPAFVTATVAAFATGAGAIALFSFLPGFAGQALGIGAVGGALFMSAWSVTSVVTALLARRLPARLSGRTQLGLGLLGVAVAQLTMTRVTPGSTGVAFVPGLLLAGVFSGVVNAALGREAVASVPEGRAALGSGANNTARYVGSAVGVTVVAVVVSSSATATPGVDGLVHGWNAAAVVTALVSVAGGVAALVVRSPRTGGRLTTEGRARS